MVKRSAALMVGACLLSGCASDKESMSETPAESQRRSASLESVKTVENLHEASDGVLMGGEPKTAESFADLRTMGVKTVISVDGITPRLGLAREHGMRYIHVPIGYDGMDDKSRAQMARALAEAERPIYVHCHHGRHRGPAAAVVGLVGCGEIDNDRAIELMELAGTSPKYKGLWETARGMAPMSLEAASAVGGELVEHAKVSSLAVGMAKVDRAWDNLAALSKANWRQEAHPDLVPANEAALMAEVFRAMRDAKETKETGEEFYGMMRESHEIARELEAIVTSDPFDARAVDDALERLDHSCAECHAFYRN